MAYTLVTDSPTYPSQNPYQIINLTADITLSWPISFGTGMSVANVNKIIPDQNDREIMLDNATLAAPGTQLTFYNTTIYNFKLLKNDGSPLVNVAAAQAICLFLSDNSTAAGGWDVIPYGGEFTNISNFTIDSSDTSIVVNNGVINPPGGIIDLKLSPSISNIATINNTGLVVVTGTDPLRWDTTSIIGGANINVDSGDGVASTPIINLNTEVDALTSLGVGNIFITGNEIVNSVSGQNILLTTEGSGVISLNGLNIDANGNFTNLGTRAFALFTDTVTGSSNTIVVESSTNVSSTTGITGSKGTYTINFDSPFSSTNYGVFFGFGSTGEPLPPSYKATWLVKETTSVTISIKDDSGELVTDLPNGVAVEIKSN